MADGAKVTVQGDETLRRTLNAAEDDIRELDQSENARLVESRARARAPKVSGRLAASVHARDMGQGVAVVESDLVYAPVIHYGWPAHHIAPQPFLVSALDESASVVESNTEHDVQAILGHVRGA